MMNWNYQNALGTLGRLGFDAWLEARKGTKFKHQLTPRAVCSMAANGDEEARQAIERFFTRLTAARLAGKPDADVLLKRWQHHFVRARVLK